MAARVVVDQERCQGHGRCYALAEEIFEPVDDLGTSGVVGGELVTDDPEVIQQLERSVAGCPERAISLLTDQEIHQ